MKRDEALRAISEDQLDYIQRPVAVDFDDTQFLPLAFFIKEKRHEVGEVIDQFRTCKESPINAFLIRTNENLILCIRKGVTK